eukprot:1381114-Rhodomonas_salina.1
MRVTVLGAHFGTLVPDTSTANVRSASGPRAASDKGREASPKVVTLRAEEPYAGLRDDEEARGSSRGATASIGGSSCAESTWTSDSSLACAAPFLRPPKSKPLSYSLCRDFARRLQIPRSEIKSELPLPEFKRLFARKRCYCPTPSETELARFRTICTLHSLRTLCTTTSVCSATTGKQMQF